MKQRAADFIADFLVDRGITQNFSVTGGGSMHLNDAFGHHPGMNTLYTHHEQASSMAAEAYSRIYNRPALVTVTSGPGGTNAITGVVGAYLDSIPMLVISGQVRFDNTKRWASLQNGVSLRAMGDQEFDITEAVACMTKYAVMLTDVNDLRYVLEKALYLMETSRPGPCWIDIPVDIQGKYVETDDLRGYSPLEDTESDRKREKDQSLIRDPEIAAKITIEMLKKSERPVFYSGNGLRIGGAMKYFRKCLSLLSIPVVTSWNAPDIIETKSPLYTGRPGGRGDRPGNLAVQNADLIISSGSRLNIRQVGYNFRTWAGKARVIFNDIDSEELLKPSVHSDYKIWMPALSYLKALSEELEREGYTEENPLFKGGKGLRTNLIEAFSRFPSARSLLKGKETLTWNETCLFYRENYPVILPEHFENKGYANVYALIDVLSEKTEESQIVVVGNGSACVAGGQAYRIKKNMRFISQDSIASMGYGLPAAVGACMAIKESDWKENAEKDPYWTGREEEFPDYSGKDLILLTGDGSLQMNIQELETIIFHHLPIKIFVINNGGYHSIRQTQKNLFTPPLVGIGIDSGKDGVQDLGFPDLEKIAYAYGYPYIKILDNSSLEDRIEKALSVPGPVITEVFVSLDQEFLPKSSAKRLPDGSLVSPPLEEMSPFLPDSEQEAISFK